MSTKPIKVLQIIPSTGYGGISSMLMNLYRNIDKNKVQFDFAAFNRGQLHDEICANGGRVFYFDYIKKQGPIAYIKKIRQLIKDNGPYSAVHVHSGFKSGFGLLASRLQGIPIRVCHIHTSNTEQSWQKPLLPILKKISLVNSTKLIACGQEAGYFMYGKKDFEILTNAINVNSFTYTNPIDIDKIKMDFKIQKGCMVIGHVGRFVQVKNHNFMINIAEKLKKMDINFKMVFIGDGPLKMDVQHLIERKGLSENIILAGVRSDIPEVMGVFDVFLFPSLFEGLPVSLLEAQASGLPCIVSTGVPKESDVGAGLVKFLEIDNGVDNWVNQIIYEVSKGRGDKKSAGSKLLENGYDIQDNIQRLMEIYNVSS
ncbi:glycosyltransferase family 1 protein [Peribacillus frigoritolerans]|uniref:glycosyltransferase family 1 protein n=1 Tax=Peribacillus frigoritolerans TaxID=450367 RepID=UPI0032B34C05